MSNGASPLRAVVIACVAIAGLIPADMFLARLERSEGKAEAEAVFRQAAQLSEAGRRQEAIDHYRHAFALDRSNRDCQLALAEALRKSGDLDEAEAQLTALLELDSANGSANLEMARLQMARGRSSDAEFYYHLAIYGRWPGDASGRRRQVRLELADLLAKARRPDLLAELLPLENDTGLTRFARIQIGHYLLQAGSPSRAATLFRALCAEDPADPDAHAGLAEAEFQRGNYAAAQVAYLAAGRLRGRDPTYVEKARIAGEMVALDPTLRRLSAADRTARSKRLLERTLERVRSCGTPPDNLLTPAEETLRKRAPAAEAADRYLNAAEALWGYAKSACPAREPDLLTLLFARLQ